MRITYAAAISQDGFIAREDGDVSWLDEMKIDPSETGLEEFFAETDGLIMGRKTYDFVFDFGSWPYEDKPTWVCTSRQLKPLEGANLFVVSEVEEIIRAAVAACKEHLWLIGGGRLASAFLDKGWITHLSISEMPITLESGIPLFADHRVEDIAIAEKHVTEKTGFRQIEIVIQN